MEQELENLNPSVYKKCDERSVSCLDEDDDVADPFDTREIFGERNKNLILFSFRKSPSRLLFQT